jgi:hypothetical protein
MLGGMNRSAVAAVALLGLITVGLACGVPKQPNGGTCLKDFDCEFERCVQYVCVDPNASKITPETDGGQPTDTAVEPEETGADTDQPDTTPPEDTLTPDPDTGTDTEIDDAGSD